MVSVQIAALVLALSGSGETVLLDFHATWCAPCRSMDGTIADLQQAGYPVRKVDTDREAGLAARYHVQTIPCFVLLVDGKEAGRVTGASRRSELLALFAKAGVQPTKATGIARAQSPDDHTSSVAPARPAGRPLPAVVAAAAVDEVRAAPGPSAAPPASPRDLVHATVRLKIEDSTGASYGSGTIVDSRGGEALVLTCGHIFRDSQGKGPITVDLFDPQAPRTLTGRLVGYNLDSDIGLVSIRPGAPVRVAPVAPKGQAIARGDAVISVGCNNGQAATAIPSRITGINKFLGSPNLQVAGLPVEGRSGGGLFTSEGLVIGVCNAADPADQEGLYAALAAIHNQLDQAGLTAVYEARPAASPAALAGAGVPPMPASMPMVGLPSPSSVREPAPSTAAGGGAVAFNDVERAALTQMQKQNDSAEVICIVRTLGDPQARSEVIMLDHASAALLKQLAVDRDAQSARHLTSLEIPAKRPVAPRASTGARQADRQLR